MRDYKYKRVSELIYERSVEESADYVEENMKDVKVYFDEDKRHMYSYAARNITLDGHIAEFGVYDGYSINTMSDYIPNKTLIGFDSFEGMPEDWYVFQQGDWKIDIPIVNKNVKLVVGYFEDTLDQWIADNPGDFAFINIDCDTYNSTKFVLDTIGPDRIKPGTVILFDEYFGYPGWRNHEFKAWKEFYEKHHIRYEYLAINHMQVLVKII
jgi:predicted O-methyltransferase YrrM